GEHSDRVHGEHHGGDRDEPEHRDARGDAHPRCGGRGRDVRQLGDRQGGDRLHADGDGRGERDQHGVQHHGGDSNPAGVLGGAEHHGGGGGGHAGDTGDGAGCAGGHGDRVHGERHSSERDEPEHRDAGGDENPRGRGGGGDGLR